MDGQELSKSKSSYNRNLQAGSHYNVPKNDCSDQIYNCNIRGGVPSLPPKTTKPQKAHSIGLLCLSQI